MKNNGKSDLRLGSQWYFVLLSLFFVFDVDYGGMMGWDHMMDWWGIPFMGFWMIGVWVVFILIAFLVYQDANKRGMNGLGWFILVVLPLIGIVFLIVYFVIREDVASRRPWSDKSAEQILDERYAKGEISSEEYLQKKKELKKDG